MNRYFKPLRYLENLYVLFSNVIGQLLDSNALRVFWISIYRVHVLKDLGTHLGAVDKITCYKLLEIINSVQIIDDTHNLYKISKNMYHVLQLYTKKEYKQHELKLHPSLLLLLFSSLVVRKMFTSLDVFLRLLPATLLSDLGAS